MGSKPSRPGIVKLMEQDKATVAGMRDMSAVIAGVNKYDENGLTALHRAILENSLPDVERLIELGADPNIKTKDGWSSFHIAAKSGNMEIMAVLLGKNVPVNEKSKETVELPEDDKKMVFVKNSTPLHIACQMGNTQAAHLLVSIAEGADKVRNDQNWTPEEVANHYNQNDIVKMLLNDVSALRVDFEKHKRDVDVRFRRLEERLRAVEGRAGIQNLDRSLTTVEKKKIKDSYHVLSSKMNIKQLICLLYNRCILNCEDMQSLRSLNAAEELQKKFIINNKLVTATVGEIAKVKEVFKDSGHGSLTECLP